MKQSKNVNNKKSVKRLKILSIFLNPSTPVIGRLKCINQLAKDFNDKKT